MEALTCIMTRRSIRSFRKESVSREILERILAAAVQAPSAKNLQNWRFVVLEEGAKDRFLNQMEEVASSHSLPEGFHSVQHSIRIMREAPVLITVHNTGTLQSKASAGKLFPPEMREMIRGTAAEVEIQGISAAIQNLLLSAHALGLGGLWIGDIHYARIQLEEILREYCPHRLVAAVALGYPQIRPPPAPSRSQPGHHLVI